MSVRLDQYTLADNPQFSRGRPAWVEALWLLVQALVLRSFIPGSWQRVRVLRMFGAHIGRGVVIKPGVRVKFPWRLEVGEHSWIGEDVWIDNLATVSIGSHAVLSQGAYVCTGSHDWRHPRFALRAQAVTIGDAAWICAGARLAPGTQVGEGAVIALGAVATGTLAPWTVYRGNPACASTRRH